MNVDPAGNAIGFRNIYPVQVYIALEPGDSIYWTNWPGLEASGWTYVVVKLMIIRIIRLM